MTVRCSRRQPKRSPYRPPSSRRYATATTRARTDGTPTRGSGGHRRMVDESRGGPHMGRLHCCSYGARGPLAGQPNRRGPYHRGYAPGHYSQRGYPSSGNGSKNARSSSMNLQSCRLPSPSPGGMTYRPGYTARANSDCTLCLISSRMARTSSIGFPLGSVRGQSSRCSPGT